MQNTCQICGRIVKATTGITSHHGYKRPEYGWQTASCMGARHQPYEVACDLIPPVISMIEEYIAEQTGKLNELVSNPPATLTRVSKNFYKRCEEKTEEVRPKGFDVNKNRYFDGYSTEFFSRKWTLEQNIRHSGFQLEYLKARLTNWKAVS